MSAVLQFPVDAIPLVSVDSEILGRISVPAREALLFEDGLLGFPECRRFALVPTDREGVLWLQSLEHGALAFLVVDPFRFFDGYTVDLSPRDLGALQPTHASDVGILCIVTLPRADRDPATVNLAGPLAFNVNSRRACQTVLLDPRHTVRAELPADLL